MRTEPRKYCILCGGSGEKIYDGLRDNLFGVPGCWNIMKCGNSRCGIAWVDPRPVEDDITMAYIHYYTHSMPKEKDQFAVRKRAKHILRLGYLSSEYGYPCSLSNWEKMFSRAMYLLPGQRAYLDFSIFYLPMVKGGRLLEVGCGRGDALLSMQQLGWTVEGIDLDPEAVEQAKKKGLNVKAGTLGASHYLENSFDAVVMSHVLEHVYNPKELLVESRKLLKKSGYLVVVTPNLEGLGHRMFKQCWRGLEPPRHINIFTISAMRDMAEAIEFDNYRVFSSIGGADYFYVTSKLAKMNADKDYVRQARLRKQGRLFQLLEWAYVHISPGLGEEIILIAKK
jgi:2-polyprenyl-3-methyl-5-hydroxy-6-metoxy-1,4-benzoquinol methylase